MAENSSADNRTTAISPEENSLVNNALMKNSAFKKVKNGTVFCEKWQKSLFKQLKGYLRGHIWICSNAIK